MTDPVAIDARAATALVAAAATSVSAEEHHPPLNDAAWERAVMRRAEAMLRLVPAVVERSEVLADCQAVTGVVARVEEAKGRGLIVTEATMGTLQRNQEVAPSGRGLEHFRTAWLNEPAGRALFDAAAALVGRHVRIGKRIESGTDAAGEALKVRMAEWIEDLGPDPLTLNHTSTPTSSAPTNGQRRPVANEPSQSEESRPERPARSPGSVTRPSREDVARAGREAAERDANRLAGGEWPALGPAPASPRAGEVWTEETFIEVGWRDRKEHDDTRQVINDTITGASPGVKARVARVVKDRNFVWGDPWVKERADWLLSRIDRMIREEETALVSVGGGEPEYGFGEEPF